jgi:ATP-binding cassette subfamily B protein RaxB
VLIDGIPIEHFGRQSFRSQIGVVMQDDQLLSGSIAENICFFDASLDLDWMRACAQVAGIDDEIMAMPMNYNTLIGDMGTTLSGGQRQRVLLARALYRRPRILFMDEGTSNLDLDKEREINRALAQLKITRIVIAHRPDTFRAADRIVVLRDGRVSPPMDGDALTFAEAARQSHGMTSLNRA